MSGVVLQLLVLFLLCLLFFLIYRCAHLMRKIYSKQPTSTTTKKKVSMIIIIIFFFRWKNEKTFPIHKELSFFFFAALQGKLLDLVQKKTLKVQKASQYIFCPRFLVIFLYRHSGNHMLW